LTGALLKRFTDLSFAAVGEIMRRDHSTIDFYTQKVKEPYFKNSYKILENKIAKELEQNTSINQQITSSWKFGEF